MSKNLNNNYSSDSTINLQIASLQTSLATLSSSLTTVQSYTATDSSTINAAITSNNTLYVLPLFNTYLSTILTTSLINSLITTNNTVYIANLLSSTLVSQNLLRDSAITTAITSAKSTFLSGINTYTANQVFSSITTLIINYIGSFNSVTLGVGCNPGSNSITIGLNCQTNSSGVAIGCNTLTLNSGINNTIIGCNSLINNTTGKSNVSIGQGNASNNVTGSYNTFLGSECKTGSNYSNSSCIGFGSIITGSN